MMISDLGDHLSWVPLLARWHYDQWGPLTGADSLDGYVAILTKAAASRAVPSVLIAVSDGALLGSANLVASDLPPRPELTPWLAHSSWSQLDGAPAWAQLSCTRSSRGLDNAAIPVSTSIHRAHYRNTTAGWDGESWSDCSISSGTERLWSMTCEDLRAPNSALEQPAGSHSLAAAAHRKR
jgi:hypothetical protein